MRCIFNLSQEGKSSTNTTSNLPSKIQQGKMVRCIFQSYHKTSDKNGVEPNCLNKMRCLSFAKNNKKFTSFSYKKEVLIKTSFSLSCKK